MLFDDGNQDIQVLTRETGDTEPFRTTEDIHEWWGRLSPDGDFIAYSSNEHDSFEVFVETYPAGGRWKVSSAGGGEPVWNPRGGELFYIAADGNLISVTYEVQEGEFSVTTTDTLFPTGVNIAAIVQPDSLNHYDVFADGESFLISRVLEDAPAVMVGLDWTTRLREQ